MKETTECLVRCFEIDITQQLFIDRWSKAVAFESELQKRLSFHMRDDARFPAKHEAEARN